jgi:hypothetical protein
MFRRVYTSYQSADDEHNKKKNTHYDYDDERDVRETIETVGFVVVCEFLLAAGHLNLMVTKTPTDSIGFFQFFSFSSSSHQENIKAKSTTTESCAKGINCIDIVKIDDLR